MDNSFPSRGAIPEPGKKKNDPPTANWQAVNPEETEGMGGGGETHFLRHSHPVMNLIGGNRTFCHQLSFPKKPPVSRACMACSLWQARILQGISSGWASPAYLP